VSGAPWWFTGLVSLISLAVGTLVGHVLTSKRDAKKVRIDNATKWLDKMRVDLKAIADAASKHYCNAPEAANYQSSCALIMADIKRLFSTSRQARFLHHADDSYLGAAILKFNDKVTGPAEFQDQSRGALAANHVIVTELRDAEVEVLEVCGRKQRVDD